MKIIFITNFMTEHQRFLSSAINSIPDVEYCFIETQAPDNSFQSLNIKDEAENDYVIRYKQFETDREKYIELLNNADIVIQGSAPDSLITGRLSNNKPVFRYCERFYKEGFSKTMYLRNRMAAWLHHGRFGKKPLYMLCASAFTSADCARFNNYKHKCYKFGYFPKTDVFDINDTVEKKRPGSIVWASRFVDWKHPEIPVAIAERLKADGYDFSLTLYGRGEMFDQISRLVKDKGLEDCVSLDDSKNSEELRKIMRSSSVFLHTADRQEGWGVVINEAMNSGCAVLASHIVGSVPYLLDNGVNGMIYEDGDIEELCNKVEFMLDNPERCKQMGVNAYNTITKMWNSNVAANRLAQLFEAVLSGGGSPDLFEDGPCSIAPIMADDWYKKTGIV